MDIDKKIIYEKELKSIYFEQYPDTPYNNFLDLLIEYANKGYSIKDQRENKSINPKDTLTQNTEILKISNKDIELKEQLKRAFKKFVYYSCCVDNEKTVLENLAFVEFKKNYSNSCNRQIYFDILTEFMQNGYKVQFEKTGTIQAIQ